MSELSGFFCTAPWKMLCITPQGDVHTCYESQNSLGNIHCSSLTDIWQGRGLAKIRKKMLAGEVLPQCSPCRKKESVLSGQSLRTTLEKLFEARELAGIRDGTAATLPAPEILDLSFSNACTHSCRICSSHYSTAWIADETRLYGSQRASRALLSDTQIASEIFPLVGPQLKKIILSGGEPLTERGNKLLLRHLLASGLTDIPLEYATNGSRIDEELFELWKRFSNVRVNFSIDCSGPRLEYLRKGASWDGICSNIRQLKNTCPHLRLRCYSTISVFNVLSYPDFIRETLDQKLFRITDLGLNYVTTPEHYSVQLLPQKLKTAARTQYYCFIKEYLLTHFDLNEATPLLLQMKMLLNFMNSEERTELLGEFIQVTKQLDTLRDEDVFGIFPELRKLLGEAIDNSLPTPARPS